MKLSAVIITKNESHKIAQCINALNWADEIVVIDSGSKDNTVEIAKSLGAKVHYLEWSSYGASKNYGNAIAKNNWIISIDADEIVSPELKNEISQIELDPHTIYGIKRINHLMGKRINYAWSRDNVWRIFHKNTAKWSLDEVHEKLLCNPSTKRQILQGELLHHSYHSMEDYDKKSNLYALLKAQKWISKNYTPSIFKKIFGPTFKAFHTYIIKLGCLDGKAGWQIARMNYHAVKRQLKYFSILKKEQ